MLQFDLEPLFLVWRKCKASRKCLLMTCKNHRLRKMHVHHHSLPRQEIRSSSLA